MSLDAIKKVTETEQLSQQRRIEAATAAKKLVADAERDGVKLVEAAQNRAVGEARTMMAEAEKKAAEYAAKAKADTERDCVELRRAAERRLDDAATLIMERIVSG